MARTHGRCRKGERLRMGFPHGHRKTTTLVAGLRSTGMVAPLVIDGPINGEWFEAYVAQVLVPTLKPGDVIATGTPSGVGAPYGGRLKAGDTVTIEIGGIGKLVNPVAHGD